MQKRGNTAGEYSHNASQRIAGFAFGYALLASILLHLFSIFSVKVFVAPAALPKGISSSMSFLGAILEQGPLQAKQTAGKTVGGTEVDYMRSLVEVAPLSAADMNYEYNKPSFPADFDMLKEMETKAGAPEEITGAKQIPQKPFDKVMVSYKAYPSEIKGPVRFREIVYKPDLPTYLRWDEELGVDLDRIGNSFKMELKFWVSPEGKVETVERVSSSGHPSVDLVGIRYLKGWQFAPIASGGSKNEQWGVIKFNFNLNKAGIK